MKTAFITADHKKYLILIIAGGLFCILTDLIGIRPAVPSGISGTGMRFPLPDVIILPLIYTAAGIAVGLTAKRQLTAAAYGFCFGLCQFLLPLVLYYFILHSGMKEQAWGRALCGIPVTPAFAWGAFTVKDKIRHFLKENKE